MLSGFINDRITFLRYAKRDVTALLEIQERKVEITNSIAQNVLGLNLEFTKESIPYTIGALVNTMFERWIHSQEEIRLQLAIRKLGMINPTLSSARKTKIQKLHEELFYSENPQKTFEDNHNRYKILFKDSSYGFLAFSNCSVCNFLMESYKTNAYLGVIIYGGRCHNERPNKYIATHVIDMDISSAYGSTLREFDYPVGNPTIHTNTHNEEPITLGEFLKLNRDKLVPGLYTIYVSGKLPFQQDLLYSKDISPTSLERISQKYSKQGRRDKDKNLKQSQ